MNKVLAIFGAGGLGREVLDLAKVINSKEHRWDEYIFVIDEEYITDSQMSVNDTLVYGLDYAIKKYGSALDFVLAIGEPYMRLKKKEELLKKDCNFATLIHPDAQISNSAIIETGVVVKSGCIISCDAVIKSCSFIQDYAIIGHDDVIGSCCVISSFCSIAGAVSVGDGTYIGINSCIREKTKIGNHVIVGMGSVVLRDIQDEVIALGNPARVLRKNEEHRVFK